MALFQSIIADMVKQVLTNPESRKWSVQGLGMLRTYISKELRLHIWHKSLEYPGVTKLHTHPWHFQSYIVSGWLTNTKFQSIPVSEHQPATHRRQPLKCGVGGGEIGTGKPIHLGYLSSVKYCSGLVYTQMADEIHFTSAFQPGTVTLVQRVFPAKQAEDMALVFPRIGERWGTAEPREATGQEVDLVTKVALDNWMGDMG